LSFCIFIHTVDKTGDVCISILHDPGEDKFGYERPEERWLPVHTVETIMVSVISMLADPNDESPANIDAAVSRSLLMNFALYPYYEFAQPFTRCATELDYLRGTWCYRSFVILF